ncbi:ABC transporter permease [Microbacterium aoyamense]|uniref:ABC transporter permease n=1 Tax=Microbacterium aoyamense TaxID=344166 RepID=A0ABP5B8V3_9MICO|nr:ABC transporter permease [Microbacterium aoyamense]
MARKEPTPTESLNEVLTIEQREVEGLSQATIVRRRFFRHRGAVSAMIVLALLFILIYSSIGFDVFGIKVPGWYPHTYLQRFDVALPGGQPTWVLPFNFGEFPFGQDEIGRDIFALVMRGAQQSITVMVVYGFVAGVLGIVIGAIAGFYRGWVDAVLMRITDVIIIIPFLILAAVIGRATGDFGAFFLAIALGLFGWTALARLVRGEFLSLREREFVDAARVAGASNPHILFRHILPNAMGVVIVAISLLMSGAILTEAALSFLGVGVQSPDVSLGQILNQYQGAFSTRPWLFWWPGLFIIALALCVNFIGDGLRDAFDPRQRRMPGKRGPYRQAFGAMFGGFSGGGRYDTDREDAENPGVIEVTYADDELRKESN